MMSRGWFRQEHQGFVFYRCPEFNNDRLIQAVSTRSCGNLALHTGDQPGQVVARRTKVLEALGLHMERLVAAVQTHGTGIRVIDNAAAGAGALDYGTALPDTDGLITATPGLILAIFTADCLPVFIYDPKTPAIGLVHAGWRGTLHGIVPKALDEMNRAFGSIAAHCWVALGPGICSNCFQVSPDLAAKFAARRPQSVLCDQAGSKFRVDLVHYNQWLLEQAGIRPERIIPSGFCTVCESGDFYSYRAEQGTNGRIISLLALA
ncbi:MAG TPA: peptidoglycan editing factor PgeF [Bacillota bacterium]